MSKKQPNVVLIISDQWSTRNCDGSGNYENGVKTPGIDRLANEGVRFENSYSAFPLCCPARASMFTGVMPHKNNIIDNEEIFRFKKGYVPKRDDLFTLGGELKKAGYDTAYFGKEHAGGYGWDNIDEFGSMKYSAGGMLSEGSAYDQIFTKDAINYLKQEHEKPFYMTLSLINPHDMCKVLGGKVKGANFADAIFFCRDDSEKYLRFQDRAKLPSNFNAEPIKGMMLHNDYMYQELEEINEDEWRRNISTYNLLIEKTDWFIELVLDTLKQQGLEEDTIVIFTTDHGDMMGSHKMIAKTNFYEESAKTHMIVKYPGEIKPSQVNKNAYVSTIDLMPTILDLCGLSIPDTVDGKSFKEECAGVDTGSFKESYSENPYGRMVRFGDYKFVKSQVYGENYKILFDLKNDPDERENKYNQSGYEEISKIAEEKLDKWIKDEEIGISFDYKKLYAE